MRLPFVRTEYVRRSPKSCRSTQRRRLPRLHELLEAAHARGVFALLLQVGVSDLADVDAVIAAASSALPSPPAHPAQSTGPTDWAQPRIVVDHKRGFAFRVVSPEVNLLGGEVGGSVSAEGVLRR